MTESPATKPGDAAVRLFPLPVVAVMRAPDAQHFARAVEVLIEAGVRSFELTMTTDGALAALEHARSRFGDGTIQIGMGTVRSSRDAERALAAGAEFLVSQVSEPEVARTAAVHGCSYVPGALTPSEIVAAWRLGVPAVKVSPIGPVGGWRYLRELVGPLPGVALMPTGGVLVEEVAQYLRLGAYAVGVSRDLFRDVLVRGDGLDGLAERGRVAVRGAEEAAA
ncbi:MAG TPA: bifunctional 4-hydroxy-2-oxoglutarate aldolase/2-dehydro-3-deoxy-phosphogluconate aldolase [Cellulomonas sp.]